MNEQMTKLHINYRSLSLITGLFLTVSSNPQDSFHRLDFKKPLGLSKETKAIQKSAHYFVLSGTETPGHC